MDVRALGVYWYKLLRICKIALVVVDHFWTYVKVNTTSENYFVNRINIVKIESKFLFIVQLLPFGVRIAVLYHLEKTVRIIKNQAYGLRPRNSLDIFLPPNSSSTTTLKPVVVFIHGTYMTVKLILLIQISFSSISKQEGPGAMETKRCTAPLEERSR